MERLRRSLEQSAARQAARGRAKRATKPVHERPRTASGRNKPLRRSCRLILPIDRRASTMQHMLKPMLASLADAPLDDPELVYEPKYDGIRAIAEIAPNGRRAALVAARQREDARSFPRSPRRSSRGRAAASARGRARRRDRRARREGRADRLPAATGRIHSRRERRNPSAPAAARPASSPRRVHRLRPAARRHDRLCAIGRCSSAARRSSALFRRAPARRSCASASRFAATAARCTSGRWRAAGKA